jgi:hypothetical protein
MATKPVVGAPYRGPVVVKLSDEAEKLRPVIARFIQSLGYSKKKGEAFAEGYIAAARKLPIMAKLRALSNQDDGCMAAGFKAAGISEREALKRNKRKKA